ncbi:MAG TPA: hypothetical protein DCM86_20350 [Verrucomicrobiales bacterium]|nr:hypothetical protein [Verrucomicrobiales bacterium]
MYGYPYGGWGYQFHWWDLLVIPGVLLGMYAQMKLSSTYSRYMEEPVANGLTGAEAARRVLDAAGLRSVEIYEVPGHLTDHYDPTKRALFLSTENYHGASISAVGVAAHEAGHALQHKEAYAPLHLRMSMVPVVNIASMGAWVAFFLGMVLSGIRAVSPGTGTLLMEIGVGLFSIMTLFHLVTLPVEFDASSRAKRQLLVLGLVTREEQEGVASVLSAAALTYVAALTASLFELLKWIMILRSVNSRDDDR